MTKPTPRTKRKKVYWAIADKSGRIIDSDGEGQVDVFFSKRFIGLAEVKADNLLVIPVHITPSHRKK